MSSTLHKLASEHSTVVAVVGKGHLQGIRKNWLQPVVVSEALPFHECNIIIILILVNSQLLNVIISEHVIISMTECCHLLFPVTMACNW